MKKLDVNQVAKEQFARIHRAALVLTGNPWDADDLAQETFLVFAAQQDRFEGRSSVYTWLYGILLNLDRRERRRHAVRCEKLKIFWQQETEQPQASPPAETGLEVAEWKQSLWAWVDRLPDGQRHALVLRFSEGLKYDEIAQVLECPVGTVKSRIFHGLAALRRMLADQGEAARQPPKFPYEDMTNAV